MAPRGCLFSFQEFLDPYHTPKCTWRQMVGLSMCLKWVLWHTGPWRMDIERSCCPWQGRGLFPAAGWVMTPGPSMPEPSPLLCQWKSSWPSKDQAQYSLSRLTLPVKNIFPSRALPQPFVLWEHKAACMTMTWVPICLLECIINS